MFRKILFAATILAPSGGMAFANSDAYPDFSGSPTTTVVAGGVLPPLNGQGEPQSINSLPQGFEVGTVPYMQAQSVSRYLQARPDRGLHRTLTQR